MTSTLLAVDPGIRGCGIAVFEDTSLTWAAYVKNSLKTGCTAEAASEMASRVREVVLNKQVYPTRLALEWPRIYAWNSKGDPNDLLALAAVDAAVAALFFAAASVSYYPSDWKGQMKKEPCHARIRSRLLPSELTAACVGAHEAKSLAHNVWDAVGIGLHSLGRFDRKRVVA